MKENQKTGLFASPEIDIPVSMLLSNVLRSIGGSLAAEKSKTDEMRKRMLLAEIEAHPGPLSFLSKKIIQKQSFYSKFIVNSETMHLLKDPLQHTIFKNLQFPSLVSSEHNIEIIDFSN